MTLYDANRMCSAG